MIVCLVLAHRFSTEAPVLAAAGLMSLSLGKALVPITHLASISTKPPFCLAEQPERRAFLRLHRPTTALRLACSFDEALEQ